MREPRCRAVLPIAFLLLAGCAVTPINIPDNDSPDAAAPTQHPDGGRGGDGWMSPKLDAPKTGMKDAVPVPGLDGGPSNLGDGLVGDGIRNDGLGSDALIGDGTRAEAGSSDAGAPKTDTRTAD